MRKVYLKRLVGLICLLSFFFLIGSVGALEMETISNRQGFWQITASFLTFAASVFVGNRIS